MSKITKDFLAKATSLTPYGTATSLYTEGAKNMIAVFRVMIILALIVDTWAWTKAWSFAINNGEIGLMPTVLGFVFASAIAIFWITIVNADTTVRSTSWWGRNKGFVFRLCFDLFLALITSVAVELAVFSTEINSTIDNAEQAAVDTVRANALQMETERYDEEIATLQSELAVASQQQTGNAEQALADYKAERGPQRNTLLATHQTTRDELTKAMVDHGNKALEETGGKFTGIKGFGPVAKQAAAQEKEMANRLEKFNHEAAVELTRFDAETQRKVDELTANRDTITSRAAASSGATLNTLRQQKQGKLSEVSKMNGRQLSAAGYPGEWKQLRGFLASYRVLDELTSTPWSANWMIKWGCRAIMIAFGLMLLGVKLFAPQAHKQYTSLAAQARAGQPEAIETVENMGYDAKTYGVDEKVVDEQGRLWLAWDAVVRVLIGLEEKTVWFAAARPNGLCDPLDEIVSRRHRYWLEHGAKLKADAIQIEQELRDAAVAIPPWPSNMNNGKDIRGLTSPWVVGQDELTNQFGWVDPTTKNAELKAGKEELVELYHKLWKLLLRENDRTQTLIDQNATLPIEQLSRQRRTIYHRDIEPILSRMDRFERLLASFDEIVPEWPRHFVDPRADLERRFIDVAEGELRPMGWRGPKAIPASA
jgi:hypothetical protein